MPGAATPINPKPFGFSLPIGCEPQILELNAHSVAAENATQTDPRVPLLHEVAGDGDVVPDRFAIDPKTDGFPAYL